MVVGGVSPCPGARLTDVLCPQELKKTLYGRFRNTINLEVMLVLSRWILRTLVPCQVSLDWFVRVQDE
jgi:hypothetical protein